MPPETPIHLSVDSTLRQWDQKHEIPNQRVSLPALLAIDKLIKSSNPRFPNL